MVKEVNELRAERLARNAYPLALVTTAQANQDPYYQTKKSHKSYAPSSKPSIPTRSHTTTRHKGNEISKPITPPSETASEENNDPEQAQRDKDITSSNSRNNNVDTTSWYKNDSQSGQFGNQRTMNVAGAREKVGSPVVEQTWIQCFNCKEFGYFAKECRKTKRVKDSTYHKEKMLLCKQAELGVPLQAEQYDCNTCLVETDNRNVIPDSRNMCEDAIQNDQNDVESDDERVVLANLISNLELDCKAILAKTSKSLGESISVRDSCLVALQNKQTEFETYKAFNDRTIDYDKLERKLNETVGKLARKDIEIKEGLKTKAYELSVVKEKHDELVKQSLLTKLHYECLIKKKTKVLTDVKLREEHDIDKMHSKEKQLKFLNEIVYKRSESIQTIHMMAPKVPIYNGRPTSANHKFLKQAQSDILCLYEFPYDQSTYANRLIPDGEETLAFERESRSKLNKDINDSFRFVHKLKQEMHADLKYVESLKKEIDQLESDKAELSNMYEVMLQECVSNDVKCSYLLSLSDLDALDEFQCLYLHKSIAISELKKLIEKGKGKSVDTKFGKPSVVRQPNAQRIPKQSVLGKPSPFLNSLKRMYFLKTKSVPKNNVSEGLSKPVTPQTLPQTARKARKSSQLKDKVVPNNSQVKVKKTQVEVHPRIPSVSNKMKSVTACKDSFNSKTFNANAIVQLILFIFDSGCMKHMTSNLKLLCNFVEKFKGTIHFGNDQFAPILGYGDLVQAYVTINMVYYVKGLNHNLFLVGNGLLIGNHGSDLYTISLQESTSSTPFCLMAKSTPTQAWLWHRRLSHLNFDYINPLSKKDIVIGLPKLKYVKDQLCSSCELSKEKRSSFKSKVVLSSKEGLNLFHMDLCGPMQVASINGKKYILVIVDDYSRYNWTLFLRSKDETPKVGTEFLTKTLNAFLKEEGIEHQTSTARTPEQNDVVERRNHTLVEAARTMLSASKLPLFFWTEATATACYT
uniref:Integrase catalytic domain-containing protein n=1 Tax=Tanacetum cinerariifolium TaxID=118510 RepID=A0A6L2L9X7_TANCI|nr:hypothetical protein [Tanacetum cinerariifolium]